MEPNSIENIRLVNDEIVVKAASEEDSQAFVDLMNRQYSRKKDFNYYNWMFVNNYLPTKIFAAFDKNIPVAFYGVQIHTLNNGYFCAQSVDIITDERYRKRGLFLLLENKAHEYAASFNTAAMMVLPNYSGMKAHNRIKSWENISKIDTLIFDCKNPLKTDIKVGKQLPNDLLSYFLKDDKFRIWRFDLNPVYNYYRINLTEKIFAVVKIFEDKQNRIKYGDIVDYEYDWSDETTFKDLIVKTTEYFRKEKVNFITCWALPHLYTNKTLIAMGFESLLQERYICVRVQNPQFNYLNDIKNWNLVLADVEIF